MQGCSLRMLFRLEEPRQRRSESVPSIQRGARPSLLPLRGRAAGGRGWEQAKLIFSLLQ